MTEECSDMDNSHGHRHRHEPVERFQNEVRRLGDKKEPV
jgi:hypothetical protein